MVFRDTSTSLGLVEDIDFWAITNSQSYTLDQKTRNINAWYDVVDNWIWQATGTWEYDDSSHTDLPIAMTDLKNGQRNYEMPDVARKIDGVSVKDSDGDWVKLKPIDKTQMGIDPEEFYETDGLPEYYDLVGRSILLYPAPASGDVTISSGLKLHLTRGTVHFSSSATTREPGFASSFHRILSLGAAKDWCAVHNRKRVPILRREINNYKKDLQEFYGARHRADMPAIRPRVESNI